MSLKKFWQNKIINPILKLLKQGITPEKIALSIALGVIIGVFPIVGTTTILCGIAAILLGLNLPAIQLVNYLVYPLQIVLLIPFYQAGEFLFRAEALPLSASKIMEMMKDDTWNSIKLLWDTTLHATVVWCILAPIGFAILYYSMLPAIKRLAFKSSKTIY